MPSRIQIRRQRTPNTVAHQNKSLQIFEMPLRKQNGKTKTDNVRAYNKYAPYMYIH
jgi:hypothetical protein